MKPISERPQHEPEPSAFEETSPKPGITWRAILLGLTLQAVVIVWIAQTELTGRVFISSWSIVMPALFLLFLLLPLNRLLARPFPGLAFSHRELLLSYLMIGVSAVLTGYSLMQVLIPSIGYPYFFATPENNWDRFHRFIPGWLSIRDPAALKGLFQGGSAVPWAVWAVPLLAWGSFLLAFCGAMLSLSALLSRQWITAERLTFPVVSVPLEMSRPHTGLFRNRLMWIGFIIPAILESLLVFNYWFPSVPALEVRQRYNSDLFTTRPWTGIGTLPWGFTPFVVGFAFLAPADISFSVWFFYWLSKAIKVFGVAMGWDAPTAGDATHRFPYPVEQCIGAFLAFGGVVLYRSAPALIKGLRSVRSRNPETGLERLAAAGLGGCLLYLIGFLYRAGLAVHWAVCLVGLCLVVAVILARIRAETGTPWAFGLFGMARNTGESLVTVFGSRSFSPESLTAVGITQWSYWDPRFFPLAHQIEALKIGDSVQMPRKRLAAILLIATFTGILIGFAACLTLSYHLGLNTAKVSEYARTPERFYLQLSDWLTNRTRPDLVGLPWIAGGAAATLMLVRARQAFLWWPFHPIGYVLAETGTANDFWFHYFLAWLLKSLILRYGGMKLYRKVLPLAVGVILGDIIAQTFWSALASLLGLPVYRFVA